MSSNQIDITGGARVRGLNGVITGTTGVLNSLPINSPNGIPQLDVNGKILVSQLPNSVMEFLGTWNAATNTPTLADGTGNAGDVYLCNVAGTVNFGSGPIVFQDGDYVVYSGSTWERSGGALGTVTSVAASITGNSVGITGSPITTAGTLAFAFSGTSGQYINGAGNLVTFPTITTEAQRLITEVYNKTGATLTKGTVVYINGGHGKLPTVTKAIATGDATSAQTYGVVQTDITNMNNGFVVVIGSLGDLDTQAYANGTQLYLSSTTAGTWTSTKQYAPAHLVYVAIVVRSHPTQGVVEVRIQNGFEMDELHNVSAQTPLNNQGLFYNTATSLWENKSIATALGYTPANDSLVVHLAGNETITGDKVFSGNTFIDTNHFNFKFQTGLGVTSGYMGFAPTQSGTLNLLNYTDGNNGTTLQLIYGNVASRQYNLPTATSGQLALTSDLASFITLTSLSATSPLAYNNTTGAFSIQVANTSQNGYLSSTDWNTFNGKQNALTNPVTGTGTTNYLPKFTGASTIGNSAITDDGTTVTLVSRALSGTSATFSGQARIETNGSVPQFFIKETDVTGQGSTAYIQLANNTIYIGNGNASYGTLSDKLTIASTGAATFSSSVFSTTFFVPANEGIAFNGVGSFKTAIYSRNSGADLCFNAGDSERMRITSGGNVGIGTTSPNAILQVQGQDIYLTGNTDNRIRFSYFGFTGNSMGAAIGYVYGVANTQEQGNLAFYTNPNYNGTGSLTERMRITSGGNVQITSGTIQFASGPTFKVTNTYAGSVFLAGGYTILEVQINGTTKYIQLYNSLN